MNILLLGQFLYPDSMGGAGRYLHDLAIGLQQRGHRVVVLTASRAAAGGEEPIGGVRVIRYGPLQRWWHLPGGVSAIRRLFRRLHREQPFDLIAPQQPLPAWALWREPQARRIPWIYHFHSPWAEESMIRLGRRPWDPRLLIGCRLRRSMEGGIVHHAAQCVTLSESMKQRLIDTHGIAPESVAVVPGCVDHERFRPSAERPSIRRRMGLPAEGPVLLSVRNLVPRQNLDGLLRAMRRIADARPGALLLIGSTGPLAGPLKALAQALGLGEVVRFLGRIADETLPDWYRAADLAVMPSKALEGFGLSTLEALACGTPVVGTPVGGTTELLSQLDPAWLAASAEPEAIASAALRLLDHLQAPQAREEAARRCQAFASQFSRPAMAERITRVYEGACCVRVLHVHTLPVISGSGLNTFLSMQGLPAERFQAELACAAGGDLLELVERHGMRVHRLRHMVWAVHPVQDALAVLELARLMRAHRYDIVHTHNSKAGVVGRLAARLAGVPVVIHTVHGFAFHDREPVWKQSLYRWLERLAAGWCDRMILISQPLVDWALRERIAPAEKMVKIYSGIDVSAFRQPADVAAIRASVGLSADHLVVGEVAKLWEGKGHDVLLRAAASLALRLPQLRVLLIGEGALRPSLERLAGALGLDGRVIFAGFRSDVAPLTQALDIAVLPSLFEGMGRAVIEAQAAGKPVIASRVGGIPDLIRHDETGLLVEPGDSEALAAAIARLAGDSALRRRLGEAGRQAADERFDAKTMTRQIVSVYDGLLMSRSCAR